MFKTVLFTLLFTLNLQAKSLPRHAPTSSQLKAMSLHNLETAKIDRQNPEAFTSRSSIKPFYEYSKTGYLVMNDDDFYGYAEEIKRELAKNLPVDATLVIYTTSSDKNYQKQLVTQYSQYIDKTRLKVLQVPQSGSNDFWSRDNLPIPVFEDGQFALVDARYYYNFEPDDYLGQLFGINVLSHNYFYEGGNFMVNAKGDCLVVNRKKAYPGGVSDTGAIPDDVFKTKYGCQRLIRLKHIKGIGHADEVVKFMSDDTVLTDTKDYKPILEQAGFKVILVPEPQKAYETYINSLIVNDTIYVPIFGEPGDQKAIDIYKQFGLKIVTINTRQLATGGQGGIHCITMNYPPATLANILRDLNAEIIF